MLSASLAACGWGSDPVTEGPVDEGSEAPSSGLPPLAGSPAPMQIEALDGEPRDLTLVLLDHAATATAERRRPFLLLTLTGCPHCTALLDALDEPPMQDALMGADILHLNVEDAASGWLSDPALAARRPHRVPALFAVDAAGQLGDRLTGDAWGEGDHVPKMAAVLAEFVRTHNVDLPRPDPSDLPEDLQPVEIAPGVVLRKLPQGLPRDVELVPVQGGPPMYRKEGE